MITDSEEKTQISCFFLAFSIEWKKMENVEEGSKTALGGDYDIRSKMLFL